jgi:transcriptional regulator with GAF, ATPase, and Fis domain
VSGFTRVAVFVGLVPAVPAGNIREALEEAEREQILATLQKSNWVVADPDGAVAPLGLKRSTLQ